MHSPTTTLVRTVSLVMGTTFTVVSLVACGVHRDPQAGIQMTHLDGLSTQASDSPPSSPAHETAIAHAAGQSSPVGRADGQAKAGRTYGEISAAQDDGEAEGEGDDDGTCEAIGGVDDACEAVYGEQARECDAIDAAEEACEAGTLTLCAAASEATQACDKLFGTGARECESARSVAAGCGLPARSARD